VSRLHLKCDGTRAEIRFRLSAKRTSPFKSAVASVQSTTGSRVVRISGSNAGYTMFRGSVKSAGYQFHSPVSLSLPLPCVTVCHHISTGLYCRTTSVAVQQPMSSARRRAASHVCRSEYLSSEWRHLSLRSCAVMSGTRVQLDNLYKSNLLPRWRQRSSSSIK